MVCICRSSGLPGQHAYPRSLPSIALHDIDTPASEDFLAPKQALTVNRGRLGGGGETVFLSVSLVEALSSAGTIPLNPCSIDSVRNVIWLIYHVCFFSSRCISW